MLVRQLANDLGDALRLELVARHRPVRRGLFLEPVPSEEVRVPRTYILCTRDHCVPPSHQSSTAKRLGATVRSIDSGHLPMLSRPEEFAGMLSQVLAETATALPVDAPSQVLGRI
jgi:pimeloyl-ACP methyl ester carboxylesterase